MCCTSIIIKPRPNSTADSIKKKKVRDKIFKLSKINPINRQVIYNVIHNNSAVNNKCNAVLTFRAMLMNIIKNKMNIKFISPRTMN